MSTRIATALVGVALCCLSSLSPVMAAETEKPSGYTCLLIGHSFFMPVARSFAEMPAQCGIEGHRQLQVGAGGVGGSPAGLWKREAKRQAVLKHLATGDIDLLGLTSYSMENSSFIDYQRWVDSALEHNPDTAFFIGFPWWQFGGTKQLAEYVAEMKQGDADLYAVVQQLRKAYPKTTFHYASYGMASAELKRLFEAGQLPDIEALTSKQNGLYRDKLGHANPILLDLAALIWLSALYDIDPATCQVKLDYQTDLRPIAGRIVQEYRQYHQSLEQPAKGSAQK